LAASDANERIVNALRAAIAPLKATVHLRMAETSSLGALAMRRTAAAILQECLANTLAT
jgi:hypothetical protein